MKTLGLIDFVFAARPMLHLPIWSVYLVSFYYYHKLSEESFQWSDVGLMAGMSLMAAGAYYLNQIHDQVSDRINRKLGFLQTGCFTANELMIAYLIVSLLGLGCALRYSFFTLIVFLQAFVLGYIYSAPPLRLKDRPVLGMIANGYAFGFLIPLTVMPELNLHNAGLLGWDNPIYFFLAVTAVYLLTTLPDQTGDRAVGKRTAAVLMNRRVVKLLALILMLLAAHVAENSRRDWLLWLALVSALPMLVTLFVSSDKLELLATKLPILLLTILAGWFYPLYFLFIVVLLTITRLYYRRRFNALYPKLA